MDDPKVQQLPRNVKTLGWTSLVNDIASEAIYAILPAFLLSLGIGKTGLGLLEGLANTTSSLLKIFFGAWSDRLGHRKWFVVIGYFLSAAARPLLALANGYVWVFAMRLSDRVGKGLRTAPRDALISESTPDSLRGYAYGFHRSMDHFGAMLGPLLAFGFLWAFPGHLKELILLTLVPGIAVVLLPIIGLRTRDPSTVASLESAPKKATFFGPLPKGAFRHFLFTLVVFTLANSSDAFLLVRAQELGVSTTYLPILWAMHSGLNSLGSRLGGRLSDQMSPRKLIAFGWVVYAAVYFGLGFADSFWHAWPLFALYSCYYSLTESPEKKLVSRLAKTGEAGSAFGWFHTMLGLANLPASLIFGLLYQNYGATTAFCFGGSVALAATVMLTSISFPPTVLQRVESSG
jgi:MFS family permease